MRNRCSNRCVVARWVFLRPNSCIVAVRSCSKILTTPESLRIARLGGYMLGSRKSHFGRGIRVSWRLQSESAERMVARKGLMVHGARRVLTVCPIAGGFSRPTCHVRYAATVDDGVDFGAYFPTVHDSSSLQTNAADLSCCNS